MASGIKILLVEDNEGDVELTKIAFEEGGLPVEFFVVHDGMEALDYLCRRQPFSQAVHPDLILLDLNMPRMGGKELLSIIRQNAEHKHIPIIILTSSPAESDITSSYRQHANCYVMKPYNLSSFMTVVKQVEDFWLKRSELPYDAAS